MSESGSVQELLVKARQRLAEAGCDTPGLDAEILLAHTLAQERTWLYIHPQKTIGQEQLACFNRLLERRVRREPIAYIVGRKAFFGLEFQVNRHVLIPRPETELLVETALQISELRPKIKIVDVGTGSGCIITALAKKLPQATLFAIDASEKALDLARQNARHHNVVDRIAFLSGNLLQPLDHPVDLIVSNPPYVSRSELEETSPEVRLYEPHLALVGGEDGLAIIQQLLPQAKEKLYPAGSLLIEIGSRQGPRVVQLTRSSFPEADIEIKKDLAGLDRLLVIRT